MAAFGEAEPAHWQNRILTRMSEGGGPRHAGESPGGSKRVLLLGVGDTHGDFAPLFEVARREPEARALLQVGDLTAGKAGRDKKPDDDPALLDELPLPLVWVHGNHEHWHALGLWDDPQGASTRRRPRIGAHRAPGRSFLRHLLLPGDEYVVPETAIRVAGIPGNFAPTWFDKPKPFLGDRVRHFNVEDVAALDKFDDLSILLMHESFRGQAPGRIGMMGIPALAGVVRRTRPQLCLTGHHHSFAVTEKGPDGQTLALSLPRAQAGYVRLWFTPEGHRDGWELVEFEGVTIEPEPENRRRPQGA